VRRPVPCTAMVTLPKVLPAPYIRGVITLYSRRNDAFDTKI
jgi:hypothetical protein